MNWRNIMVVFRKELKDSLRDRRTLFATIVLPIVMFPLMTLGFGTLAMQSVKKMQKEAQTQGSTIMILGATNAPVISATLSNSPGLKVVPFADDYVQRINDKKLRAAVEFPPGFEAALESVTTNTPEVRILHYTGEMRSQIAAQTVESALRKSRDEIVGRRLAEKGLSRSVLTPFTSKQQNVAEAKKVGGNLLGGLIPYLIVFLSFMGAMNPAIDLTAGEKERGTIETILASPVHRTDLVIGKFLLVLMVSMITATISITSFAGTFMLPITAIKAMSQAGSSAVPFAISGSAVISVLFLMIPLAVMFSGMLLSLGLFARSAKEAQAYLSPLIMLVVLPSMAGMLPGFELNAKYALVPILNVSLMAKDLLTGHYDWGLVAMVFGSTCVYAALALSAAVWAFKQEWVLFRT